MMEKFARFYGLTHRVFVHPHSSGLTEFVLNFSMPLHFIFKNSGKAGLIFRHPAERGAIKLHVIVWHVLQWSWHLCVYRLGADKFTTELVMCSDTLEKEESTRSPHLGLSIPFYPLPLQPTELRVVLRSTPQHSCGLPSIVQVSRKQSIVRFPLSRENHTLCCQGLLICWRLLLGALLSGINMPCFFLLGWIVHGQGHYTEDCPTPGWTYFTQINN